MWFEVAKDARRPFVVASGDVRVRAAGTAFSVRRRETGVEILVTESVVETCAEGDRDLRMRLKAGDRVMMSAHSYHLTLGGKLFHNDARPFRNSNRRSS